MGQWRPDLGRFDRGPGNAAEECAAVGRQQLRQHARGDDHLGSAPHREVSASPGVKQATAQQPMI